MKSVLLLFGLVGLFTFMFYGIKSCNESLYGKDGYYTKQKPKEEKCVSERALLGCEKAGFEMEHELEQCMWAFSQCERTNEILQQKLKGEKEDAGN